MKMMSKLFLIAVVSLMGKSALASDLPVNEGPARKLLDDIRVMTLQCAVRPYAINAKGEKVYYAPENTCPTIRIINSHLAGFQLGHQTFIAELVESSDSDGGDLDDLYILSSSGRRVAWRHNVAAFNEILTALAGGTEQFREVRVYPKGNR